MQLTNRNLVFFLTFFLSISASFAQQAPLFTYHTNTYTFSNPGYAGMGEGICLNGIVRQQWSGFEDGEGENVAPENFLVTADMPTNLDSRVTLGLIWAIATMPILVEAVWVLVLPLIC